MARREPRFEISRAFLAISLLTASVAAQDPQAEAKRLFDLGMTELQAGHNEDALSAFLKSRAIRPTRVNTQNAALMMKRLGRYDEALELLRRMPEEFPNLTAAQREALSAEIEELEASTGLIDVESSEAGAIVVVAGRPRGTVPLGAPVRVNPGQHSVRIERDGRVIASTLVQVAAGGRVGAAPTVEAQAPTETPPRPKARPKRAGPPPVKTNALAADLPWHRLRFGLSAGGLFPFGTYDSYTNLSEIAGSGVAVEADVGFAVSRSVELGAYLSLARSLVNECEAKFYVQNLQCSASLTRAGLEVTYRTAAPTSPIIPYVGFALRYDSLSVTREVDYYSGSSSDMSFSPSSMLVRAQGGLDFALSATLLLGPRVAVSLGSYTETGTHLWVDAGARVSFRTLEL